ncbi:peptidyl-tRNA hydrolase [Nakamurella deserti]|uniref:peptidyl-tRNA hydrolase n=1 Tax=Nakamurella deserti TaxID=2164074 RepID=UPI000DBE7D36|nr:peptidyl-tRNA hydrolase [Nakamurella deserti]
MTPEAFGAVLAPLAERHAHWMSLRDDEVLDDRDEAAEDVRAMQLILRLEREQAPSWSSALAAACTAATAICLDERAAPGGAWHDPVAGYVRAHIRKVTRRARAGQWQAVQDLPGTTVTRRDAEVRALLPGPVTDLDKRVGKLQVGGTDLPVDLRAGDRPVAPAGVLLLQLPAHIPMTAGKLMAQTGHAGMITAALLSATDGGALQRWWAAGLPTTVALLTERAWSAEHILAGDAHAWEHRRVAVRDAGFTEIDPGTVTVIADATGL